MLLTTGGFAALSVGMKVVADPGDEVIYSLPPWFVYEALVLEAGLVPVKVPIDRETLDLDLDAIAAAITPRTRIVIVNTPEQPDRAHLPAGDAERLAAVLDEASARNGRRIFLLSDEPYNRIVFNGARFRTPAEFYPYTLIAYSYGKTLLVAGQRIGYLALPPALPDREALRAMRSSLQIAVGWLFPNAVMQYALPELEQLVVRHRAVPAQARPDGRGAARDRVPRRGARGHVLPLPRVAARRRRRLHAALDRRACS